jgi:hypothetical protein
MRAHIAKGLRIALSGSVANLLAVPVAVLTSVVVYLGYLAVVGSPLTPEDTLIIYMISHGTNTILYFLD